MTYSPGGGSPSPRRVQKECLVRYIDTLVASLVEKAAEQHDPLTAITNILTGDYMQVTESISSDELRTLLFEAYNAYDSGNNRALKGSVLQQFLTDFITTFANYLGGLEIPAVQHESWEDRSRWDAAKLDLLLRANRLKVGFEQDPERWLTSWVSFLDTTGDGKGIRYAEIQAAFAGARTPEWLAEINKCCSLTEGPITTPIPPQSRPNIRQKRDQPTTKDAGRWLTSGQTSYTPRAKSSPGHHSSYSSEMTLDIADAASFLAIQEKQRFGFCLFIYYVLYFIIIATMFGLYVDAERTSSLQLSLRAALTQKEFLPNRRLEHVQTISEINTYITNVWIPYMHYANEIGILATTPQLRQRLKRIATSCEEEVRIASFNRSLGNPCFEGDEFLSGEFKGVTDTYTATDYRGTYKTPVVNADSLQNRDFLVRFTAFSTQISPTPPNTLSVPINGTVSEAQTDYGVLATDEFMSYQMAFVELTAAMYTNDEDVYANTRIVFAMTESGLVEPFSGRDGYYGHYHHGSTIETRRVVNRDTDHEPDNARLSFEIMFAVFSLTEIIYEIYSYVQSYRHTRTVVAARLVGSYWSVFRLILFSTIITITVLHLTLEYPSTGSTETLDNASDIADGHQYVALLCLGAILLMLSAIRVLSTVGVLSKFLETIVKVVGLALPSLFMFCLLFMVCVFVFAYIGHYCFGHGSPNFSTMARSMEQVLPAIILSLDYGSFNNPLSDPSQGVIAPLYYWFAIIVIGVLLATTMVSIFVSVYEAAVYSFNLQKKSELDVPQVGRVWSREALSSYSSFPSTLLKYWKKNGWVTPVSRHKLTALCSAEIVENTSLRIMISTSAPSGRDELFSSRGIVFLLPPELLRNSPRNKANRTQLVKRCSLFTRCQAGLEPKNYNIRDWVQYAPEWWMHEGYQNDFSVGGTSWKALEAGIEVHASPDEIHRRSAWLTAKQNGSEAEACSADHFTSTTYVPYVTGTYRSRLLRIEKPLRELLQNGPKWEHESVVFEFPDVVSSQWPCSSVEHRGTTSLPVKGVYKTHATTGPLLVVVIGDQPHPNYIATGNERFTAAQIMNIKGTTIKRYADQMIVGRFGISNNRTPSR
eukprot:TRINITY_DN517_c0_g2_i1.p1 TRINITY_DN517_c0_g2~~TRINITY_DN517_c0_g2_i1.p1  ORF type:complete len:1100 (+),score=165.31 TRINITY_DN517_c0_g2_i1:46-3345(+)